MTEKQDGPSRPKHLTLFDGDKIEGPLQEKGRLTLKKGEKVLLTLIVQPEGIKGDFECGIGPTTLQTEVDGKAFGAVKKESFHGMSGLTVRQTLIPDSDSRRDMVTIVEKEFGINFDAKIDAIDEKLAKEFIKDHKVDLEPYYTIDPATIKKVRLDIIIDRYIQLPSPTDKTPSTKN
jgi:hypothetical protein